MWCLLMGFGASWLSGMGTALGGADQGVMAVVSAVGVRGLLLCGLTVASLGLCAAVVLDFGLLGTSVDRAGAAVCLVWLVLFEGVFFFGAVWTWGLVIDMQGHSVGVWGHGADAGVGVGLGTLGAVQGLQGVSAGLGAVGAPSCGSVVWASGQSASVLGIVLLPVLGSLLVLLGVSLVLQLVHRAAGMGAFGGSSAGLGSSSLRA